MKIEINKINFEYRDEGSGIPVIFIHAFPLNQTMWDEQVAALKNHCRVITLDLLGFGESDVPDARYTDGRYTDGRYSGAAYTMDQMASDVRGLMSALGV